MSGVTRRALLNTALAGGVGFFAAPVWGAEVVRPPAGPMRLSRKLVRGLSGGEQIVVERVWSIQIAPQGRGLAVNGTQVSVHVDAPERIAPIAAIERNRVTDGKFPILLTGDGLIVAAGEEERAEDVALAINAAQNLLASANTPASRRRQVKVYLGQIQAAGSKLFDRLPSDLFFPKRPGFTDRRPVDLPGGKTGEFIVRYSASARPENGLLDRADRQIITRVSGTEQASSEHWQLSTS